MTRIEQNRLFLCAYLASELFPLLQPLGFLQSDLRARITRFRVLIGHGDGVRL